MSLNLARRAPPRSAGNQATRNGITWRPLVLVEDAVESGELVGSAVAGGRHDDESGVRVMTGQPVVDDPTFNGGGAIGECEHRVSRRLRAPGRAQRLQQWHSQLNYLTTSNDSRGRRNDA
jgi:hypothetical protein